MHKLLTRQIHKYYGDSPPSSPDCLVFLAAVDSAYCDGDADRALLERSIELASAELFERNTQLERDLESIKRLEMELLQAEKLRAVGQLAAGIAHEINTPIQYVGDSVHFLKSAFADLVQLANRVVALCAAAENGDATGEPLLALKAAAEELDLDYLLEEGPKAFEHTIDGIGRVARIVAAMKELGRKDQSEKVLTDVAHCIESTLIVAQNELKYVADVEVTLEPLALVLSHPAELCQVLLNLLVNAAHAVEERFRPLQGRGCVRVTLERRGQQVAIVVSDNGCGIPESIKLRVFEPFFTTKIVGKGTGQGLAIAKSIIEKLGGSLTFESHVDEGTTFLVTLPFETGQSTAVAPDCDERSCSVG